jgi:hypothetical protein
MPDFFSLDKKLLKQITVHQRLTKTPFKKTFCVAVHLCKFAALK